MKLKVFTVILSLATQAHSQSVLWNEDRDGWLGYRGSATSNYVGQLAPGTNLVFGRLEALELVNGLWKTNDLFTMSIGAGNLTSARVWASGPNFSAYVASILSGVTEEHAWASGDTDLNGGQFLFQGGLWSGGLYQVDVFTVPRGTLLAGESLSFDYRLELVVEPVPEPGALALAVFAASITLSWGRLLRKLGRRRNVEVR